MTRKDYIKYGVIAIGFILTFILLMNIFGGKGHVKLEAKLAASEEREKAAIREREMYRGLYNDKIAEGLKKDSLLAIKIKQSEIRIKEIPAAVRSVNSKDELRKQGADFKPEPE